MQGDWFWHELHTTDAKKAADFYGKILGWKTREMPMGPGEP
jgi:predicted enzyme related to lactoylglutathione lyase